MKEETLLLKGRRLFLGQRLSCEHGVDLSAVLILLLQSIFFMIFRYFLIIDCTRMVN